MIILSPNGKIHDNPSLKASDVNRLPFNRSPVKLGSILVNNDIIDEVSTIINSNTFYDPAHIKIYEVIENLNNKGMIANPITLKNYFEKDNMLSEVGGTEYLVKLTRFSGSTKQAIDYAKIVHENFVKRELIQISHSIKDETLKKGEMVIVIEGSKEKQLISIEHEKVLFEEIQKLNGTKAASKIVSKISSKTSKEIYSIFSESKNDK